MKFSGTVLTIFFCHKQISKLLSAEPVATKWLSFDVWAYFFVRMAAGKEMSEHTSTAWIRSPFLPCLNVWKGFPPFSANKYATPWSLPHTATFPFSPNTPCLTNLRLVGTSKWRVGAVRVGEYKSKPLAMLSINTKSVAAQAVTFPLFKVLSHDL